MITLPKTNMTISIALKDGVWETTLILGGPTFGAMLVLVDFSLRTPLEAGKWSGPLRSAQRLR